jgi:hypothetical protein
VSGPSSEEPETAPFVKEQQSRAALLLVVRSRHDRSVAQAFASVQKRKWPFIPLFLGVENE